MTLRVLALVLLVATSAFATKPTALTESGAATGAKPPAKADIRQVLDTQLPLDLFFRNEQGAMVRLGDYFKTGRPVVLHFMYHRCPMLCSMVLDGLSSSMSELKYDIGKDFDVISVSVDPRDTATLAAKAKEKYVRRYGRLDAANGWHFLTGGETYIKTLADAVGFEYSYDLKSDQFAHGATIIVLTPEGRVSRYLMGFEYKARDLRLALAEASAGKIGGAAEKIMLLCYQYDATTGKYSRSALNFMRAGGVATILSLASFIIVMVRRDRRNETLR